MKIKLFLILIAAVFLTFGCSNMIHDLTGEGGSFFDALNVGAIIELSSTNGTETTTITAKVLDLDDDDIPDGLDLDDTDSTIELALVPTETTGVYRADLDGNGISDFYLINNGSEVILNTKDNAEGTTVALVTDNTSAVTGIDIDGDNVSDITVPDNTDNVLDPGQLVVLPTTDGTDSGNLTGIIIDTNGDGFADGIDLDGNTETVEMVIGTSGTTGSYSVDADNDGIEDLFVIESSGVTTMNTAVDGTGDDAALVLSSEGEALGLDLTGDGSLDLGLPRYNDNSLSPGEIVLLPVKNATGTELDSVEAVAVDLNGDNTVEGLDIDGNTATLEIAFKETGVEGLFAADTNADGTPDAFITIRADGEPILTASESASNTDLWLVDDGSGGFAGFGGSDGVVTAPLANTTDNVLNTGEAVFIPVFNGTMESILTALAINTDEENADPVEGLDLDGDPSTIELFFTTTPSAGSYPIDPDIDGDNDYYLEIDGGVSILTTSSGGTATNVQIVTDADGTLSGWDLTGSGTAEIDIPLYNDDVLTPGEYVTIPSTDGTTEGTLERLVIGDGSGGVSGLGIDDVVDIPFSGSPSDGSYPVDPDEDEVVNYYLRPASQPEEEVVLATTSTGTTTNVRVVTETGTDGELLGFDLTGNGTVDVAPVTATEGLDYILLAGDDDVEGTADDEYAVRAGSSTILDEELRLPDTHEGLPVTTIYSNGFAGSSDHFTSIVFGANIDTIDDYAFAGTNVINCTIPAQVTILGKRIFRYSKLENLVLEPTEFALMDDGPSDYCFAESDSLTTVELAEGTTVIPSGMFYDCPLLETVNLPTSLKEIQYVAFGLCPLYTNGDFSSLVNLEAFGTRPFSGTGITSVSLPTSGNLTDFGRAVFAIDGLTSLTLPAVYTTIPDYFLEDSSNITDLDIQGEITAIGLSAFKDYAHHYDIPSTVTSIGQSAFIDSGITSVAIPAGVTEIPNGAFLYVDITTLNIPGTVKTIGPSAIYSDTLTSLTLNEGLEVIEPGGIKAASQTPVTVPSTVTEMGRYAIQSYSGVFTLLPTTPPTATETPVGLLENVDHVIVPDGSLAAYRSADGWDAYLGSYVYYSGDTKHIYEEDFSIDGSLRNSYPAIQGNQWAEVYPYDNNAKSGGTITLEEDLFYTDFLFPVGSGEILTLTFTTTALSFAADSDSYSDFALIGLETIDETDSPYLLQHVFENDEAPEPYNDINFVMGNLDSATGWAIKGKNNEGSKSVITYDPGFEDFLKDASSAYFTEGDVTGTFTYNYNTGDWTLSVTDGTDTAESQGTSDAEQALGRLFIYAKKDVGASITLDHIEVSIASTPTP